jgi:putative colanic acid biosynthesis glycosyltransferase WcaI
MEKRRRPRPRLLVLNQYYWPGVEATAHLLTELCESLAEDFDVQVLTGVVRDHEHAPHTLVRNGVSIRRVASTAGDRAFMSRRALNYVTYLGSTLAHALRARRPDVVLTMTDPPMVGAAGVLVARRHRAPLVIVSEDVFPEIATALGRLRNPLVVATLRRIVRFGLRRADRVVAIGETMRERLLAKGTPAGRIRVIPNWVDTQAISPRPRDNAWARENGLEGSFVVMHSGNVGHAQDLDTLIHAATLLRDLDDLLIVVIGLGARHAEISALAERLAPGNVRFLPYQPRERLPESLSSADVHVVGLAPGLAGYVVPSRVYGILAAGRPVIAAVDADSETAKVVADAACGVHVPPGDAQLLARAIRGLHRRRAELAELGRNARLYAEREAERTVALGRYRELLDELLGER